MIRSAAPVLLAAFAVALLLACGSDDRDDPTPTPVPSLTRPPTPPGPTAVPGPGVEDTRILLGMTNDLAGNGGTPYAAVTFGIQAYLSKVNEEDGGVCGRDAVLVAVDDNYAPHLAFEQTRNLVEQQQVLAMIGALSTEAHKQVAAYLNDPNGDTDTTDGIPDLFVSTGWSPWGDTSRYPWTVGFIPSYAADARTLARHAQEQLGEDAMIGLLYRDDDAGRDYLEALQDEASEDHVVAKAVTASVRAPVESLQSAGVEAVLSSLTPDLTAAAIRSAGAVDYDPLWLISYTNSPGALAAALGGGDTPEDLVDGFEQLAGAVTTAYLLTPVQHADDPAMLEHARIMSEYDGSPVSNLTVYGQALAETLVETLARTCHDLTRPGVLRAAESLTGYRPSLMLPDVTLDLAADDHHAIDSPQLVEITELGELLAVDESPEP